MFGRNKTGQQKVRPKAGAADTLITRETKITGDIHFTGMLYIDGHIEGNITADETEMSLLTIGKHGVVEGQIEVPHIIILGKVVGDVYATEHIELESSSHVEGDVYYKLIEMAMGAEVNGKLVHRDDKPKLLNHDKISKTKNVKSSEKSDSKQENIEKDTTNTNAQSTADAPGESNSSAKQ